MYVASRTGVGRAVSKYLIEDWIGKYVGDWLILGYSHLDKEHYWSVRCVCGKVYSRRVSQLMLGRTHSCRTCSAKKREAEKSPFWRGLNGISLQYLNRLSFRGKEVTISLEDLAAQWEKQERKCAYSGIELFLAKKDSGWRKATASIDRIDSSKGYTPENIQWVHKRVNTMKNDMSEIEFLQWCNTISKHKGGSCGV